MFRRPAASRIGNHSSTQSSQCVERNVYLTTEVSRAPSLLEKAVSLEPYANEMNHASVECRWADKGSLPEGRDIYED